MYLKIFKPLTDRVGALLLLLLLSPVLILLTVLLWIISKRNPFFFQSRPGLHEKSFLLIKFCTMTDSCDTYGNLKNDEERLTPTGKWLRKTSLDELPQLINVLRGDMSFIGPRPLLPEYLPFYNGNQKARHNVKPGITGWAQVNGRNTLSWEEKFELDGWYVDHSSFLLDMRIIFLTVINVLRARDISSPASATMEKFQPQSK